MTYDSNSCARLTGDCVAGASPVKGKVNHRLCRKPCVGHREVAVEASVAERAGKAIERRKIIPRGAEALSLVEGSILQPSMVRRRGTPRRQRPIACTYTQHRDLGGLQAAPPSRGAVKERENP